MNAWGARHTPGAGGKASLELLKALARDGDRVDLDDAHAEILRQAPGGSPGTDYAADNPPPAAHRVRSARSNPTVSSGRSGRPAESVRNGRGCRRITQRSADISIGLLTQGWRLLKVSGRAWQEPAVPRPSWVSRSTLPQATTTTMI